MLLGRDRFKGKVRSGNWLTGVLLLCGAVVCFGQERELPRLSADEPITFNEETGALQAMRNAELTTPDFRVEADEIRYFRGDQRAEARGHVRLTAPGLRVVTDKLRYDATTRRFEGGRFRLAAPPVFAKGASFAGTTEEITFAEATLYYGEPDPFVARVSTEQTTLRPGQSVSFFRLRPQLGPIPLLPMPRFTQPLATPGFDFTGRLGYRSNLGAYAQTETLFPAVGNWRAGANLDLYTERGLLAGPRIVGESRSEDGRLEWRSELSVGWIADQGGFDDRGFDVEGRRIPIQRGWARARHTQAVADTVFLNGQLGYLTDPEVERDFRPDLYETDPQPDTYVEALAFWKGAYLTVFARPDVNGFYREWRESHRGFGYARPGAPSTLNPSVERLPEVRLDLPWREIADTGIRVGADASWAYLRSEEVYRFSDIFFDGSPADYWIQPIRNHAHRLDGNVTVTRPVNLWTGATFTPVVAARGTWWSDSQPRQSWRGDSRYGETTRLLMDVGADFEMTLARTFAFENKRWDIDGLRHLIRPTVEYRWRYDFDEDRQRPYGIDRFAPAVSRPELDLADARAVDELEAAHVALVGVEQLLETRGRDGTVRELARLAFYQTLDFEDAERYEDREFFSAAFLEFAARPASWIEVGYHGRFAMEGGGDHAARGFIKLRSGSRWELRLLADYIDSDVLGGSAEGIEEYGADLVVTVHPRWDIIAQVRYDGNEGHFREQRYGLRQRLGRTWELEYGLVLRSGDDRADSVGVFAAVDLIQF